MIDLHFETDVNQKVFHMKQQDFTFENKAKIKDEIQSRLKSYYESKISSSNSSLDYLQMDDKQLEGILSNTNNLESLKSFLVQSIEVPEKEVENKFAS